MSRLLKALKRLDDSGALWHGLPTEPPGSTQDLELRVAVGRPRHSASVSGHTAAPRAALPPQSPSPTPPPPAKAVTPAPSPTTSEEMRDVPESAVAPSPEPWPGGESATVATAPERSAEESSGAAIESTAATSAEAPCCTPAEPPSRPTRSDSPGRRASDRYRVAPEYVALCKTVIERVPRTRPTSILIVPATREVDAGTVAAELALSMAQAVDLPIVAIDADLSADADDPDAAVSTSGVSDVLLDEVDWRGVLAPARDRRVQLLAAGRPLSGSDAIASAATRLGPIVSEIKTRYRYLIVHAGPPSNPLTGAWVQASDLVYLVVRLGQTTRRDARSAKRALERGGAIVHGSILLASF